ncbi:hypothetical protein SLA2020_263770 [Shorea laevis]
MSTILLPDLICNSLDKIFKDFWWGFPKDKTRNLSLKSWSSMCIPRALGGLGLRQMKAMNLALITKLGWKFISNQDSLWVKQFSAKYIKYGDFFSTSISTNASAIWKGILQSKSVLVSNACIQISKFTRLPIWTSSWIPTLPSFRPAPRHPSHHELPSLLISDLFHPESLQWRSPLISLLFEEDSAKAIMELKISTNSRASYIWTPSISGILLQIQLILLSFIILASYFLPSIFSLERALEIKIK